MLVTQPVQAHEFLDEAVETMRKRATQRDAEKERSMAKTVAIFNAWTGGSMSEADGWRFMMCLKQAREIQGKFHRDDYVDLSAYAGLLGEHLSSQPVLHKADAGNNLAVGSNGDALGSWDFPFPGGVVPCTK